MLKIRDITNLTNGGLDIFKYYINEEFETGRAIRSPLRPDQNPSFSVFKGDDGTYLFKDHGEHGKSGNAVQFVKELRHLGFSEALEVITKDLGLKDNFKSVGNSINLDTPEYTLGIRQFTEKDKAYWQQYGISLEKLAEYGLKSIKEYSTTSVQNQPIIIKAHEQVMFAYDHNSWAKIYRPNDQRYRFRYLGFKPKNFIFGYNKLPQKGELVIITGGEKDVLSLASRGYNAICLNSETACLDLKAANELKSRFDKVLVLYDNDKTGLLQSEKLASEHGFYRLELPEIPNGGKDIADFFKEGCTVENLDSLIANSELYRQSKGSNEGEFISAAELMAMGDSELSFLWKPFFPSVGTGVIAGMPDTGKSQFARNLCVCVTSAMRDFLGFEMNVKYGAAIYVATEDGIDSTRFLIRRQTQNNNNVNFEKLHFLFGDSLETAEILQKLEEKLAERNIDLVVVDSFGDIFLGGDSNNNIQMRKTVNSFNQLASRYNCFILFVHHINKGAYDKKPGQQNIQGGSGLTQKVRIAIQISPGNGNKRYFSVVKGNYCPKEYKEESLELIFDQESFLFSSTGKRVKVTSIGKEKKVSKKLDNLEEIATEYFAENPVSFTEFVSDYEVTENKSKRTATRILEQLKKSNLITGTPDGYILSSMEESE